MIYREECCDLFDYYEKGYSLVQCLSADLVAGAGIAVLFNEKLNMKNRLKQRYPYGVYLRNNEHLIFLPTCVYEQNTFNLITKDKVWEKPTYENFELSLKIMKLGIANLWEENIFCEKIAMPLIGCGIDGLEWKKVREIIKKVFYDYNIEIVVCYLDKDKDKVKDE